MGPLGKDLQRRSTEFLPAEDQAGMFHMKVCMVFPPWVSGEKEESLRSVLTLTQPHQGLVLKPAVLLTGVWRQAASTGFSNNSTLALPVLSAYQIACFRIVTNCTFLCPLLQPVASLSAAFLRGLGHTGLRSRWSH